jgi:hypothetical protein
MRTRGKVALVVPGYVVAVLLAAGVVAAYVALTDSPDRQASSGMYAFGESGDHGPRLTAPRFEPTAAGYARRAARRARLSSTTCSPAPGRNGEVSTS